MKKLLVAVAAVAAFGAFGKTIYVDDDAAEGGDGSLEAPFKTIAEGIGAADAATQDEVVVADGTYVIEAQISVNKAITVRSASDDPSKVTINAKTVCRVMEFTAAGATVRGLRILNGTPGAGQSGGGIKLTKKGRVENCIIESCQACTGGSAGHGGGLYVDAGSVVTGCIVKNCYTTQNGDIKGIGVYIANGTLEHSLVYGSKRTKSMAKPCYGAVYLAKGTVDHCTVANNTMSNCGGIYVADSDSCTVKDTVIWGNVADRQAGDGAPNFNAGVTKPTFSHVCSSFEKGEGSMAANPMFADAAKADFSLLPGSPCIGAASDGGDIGYKPYDQTKDAIGIKTSAFSGVDSLAVDIELTVSGAYSLDGATVTWAGLDETGVRITHTFGLGVYEIAANVTFAGGETTVVKLADPITVKTTSDLHVVAGGKIEDAVALAVGSNTIYIDPGTYTVPKTIEVLTPLKFVGTGLVTNVTVKSSDSGIFHMTHANALISGLRLYGAQSSGVGGGVHMTAGTVTNCVIQNCKSTSNQDGGGIWMSGGLVTHCKLTGNMGYSYAQGSGICMSGGTVDNCLIVGNGNSDKRTSTSNKGGGIYMTGGLVKNCTVAGNTSCAGGGIYRSGGFVVNTILYGNDEGGGDHAGKPDWQGASETAWSNCCFSATATATGANPQVASATPYLADWSIDPQNGACCIDTGTNAYVLATLDYLGQPRIFGKSVDIGAIEYCEETVTPGYQADVFTATNSLTVNLHATITGGEPEDFEFAWYFDGDETTPALTGQDVTKTFTAIGGHSVRLIATRDGVDYPTEWSDERYFKVLPEVMYVSTTGSNTFPYATPEDAATDIQNVIDIATCEATVRIEEGRYRLTKKVEINYDLRLFGAGMDKTVFYVAKSTGVLDVNSRNAYVEGLCVSNGVGQGGGVWIHGAGGTVTKCRITKCTGGTNAAGGGAYVSGANSFLSRCIISNCKADDKNSGGSAISNYGSGIYQTGGRVDDCLIIGCESDGGGVCIEGGQMWNCVVTGCTTWNSGSKPKNNPGGIFVNGAEARIYNCILWKNRTTGLAETSPVNDANWLSLFSNCLFDSARNWTSTGTDGVVADDPGFRDAANGDYRTGADAPGYYKGVVEEWMRSATDFDGNPRAYSPYRHCDIGLSQAPNPGLMLLVK